MDFVTKKENVVSLSLSLIATFTELFHTWRSDFFLVQLKVTDEDVCEFYHLYLIRAVSWLCATLHSSQTHKQRISPSLHILFLLSTWLHSD